MLDFEEHKRKLDRAILRDTKRAEKLAEILEANPDASRKEIRRIMKSHFGKDKKGPVP